MNSFTETAAAGPLLVAIAVSVLAGLVSFASPCVVPLVPGYLSYLAAVDFVVDHKVTFPSIYDPAMRTMIAFGGKYPTTVIPSTLVLDRQHRVAAVFLRELLADDLKPVVERLAKEGRA